MPTSRPGSPTTDGSTGNQNPEQNPQENSQRPTQQSQQQRNPTLFGHIPKIYLICQHGHRHELDGSQAMALAMLTGNVELFATLMIAANLGNILQQTQAARSDATTTPATQPPVANPENTDDSENDADADEYESDRDNSFSM